MPPWPPRGSSRSTWTRARSRSSGPAALAAYEEAIGRAIHGESYDLFSAGVAGNVETILWLVEQRRVASWAGALAGLLVHASIVGDWRLRKVRRALDRGCPPTNDAYGRYHNYRPEYFRFNIKPAVAVVAAFFDLIREPPGNDFLVDALCCGHLEMLDAFEARRCRPATALVNGVLHCLPVESLEWLRANDVTINLPDADRVLRDGKLPAIAWLHEGMHFFGHPDLPLRCVRVNNFRAFEFLVKDKGEPYDARALLAAAKKKPHLDAEFIVWFMDNLVIGGSGGGGVEPVAADRDVDPLAFSLAPPPTRVTLETVLVALRAHLTSRLRCHKDRRTIRELYEPRVRSYLHGLERLAVPELRGKCKLFGIKPKGVRGKGPAAYVDCLRRSFALNRIEQA